MSADENTNFKKVTHCIFDMDGLLLDTEKLYTQATQQILDKYGKTYTWEVKVTIMGLNRRAIAEHIVAAYELPMTWEEYSQQQFAITADLMADAQLLPDTEVIYERVVRQIASTYNKSFPIEVRVKMLGTTEPKSAEIAITGMQLPITIDEYLKVHHALCRQQLKQAPLLKGVERLVRHLAEHNVPIAVATSSGEDMVQIKISQHEEVFKLFQHRVCGSTDPEVKEGKPAPDIFLVAASRFIDNPEPAQCLVFEDAPNGVRAAVSAGMQVVMIPNVQVPVEMCADATQVLNSMEDFKPELFGLPAFSECSCASQDNVPS